MSKEHFKLKSAAHLFLVRNDKILLLRRFNTGYKDGNYSVPAGHLDGGESVKAAMVRESLEEIGIIVRLDDLKVVHVMHRIEDGEERIDFFLTTTVWTGEPKNKEPNKCDELHWFPIDDMPSNVIPYIRSAIKDFKANSTFSEFGWN